MSGGGQWAAAEARDIGWGGVSLVARATGLSRPTILAGLRELQLPATARAAAAGRIRRPGGGRHPVTVADPQLLGALTTLLEPVLSNYSIDAAEMRVLVRIGALPLAIIASLTKPLTRA